MIVFGRAGIAMLTLLLVEDDELSREVLGLQLSAAGFQVATADSGDAALALLRADPEPPDVVLSDLQLPGISGNALAQKLRQFCHTSSVLLAISASTPSVESWQEFDGFLLKPFAMEALSEALQRESKDRRTMPGVPTTTTPLDEATYGALLTSMPGLRVSELYELCLSDAETRIAAMQQAGAFLDAASFRHQAHTIRGSCSMVGAKELEHLAGLLEENGLDATNYVASLDELLDSCHRLRRMLSARRGEQETHHKIVPGGVA